MSKSNKNVLSSKRDFTENLGFLSDDINRCFRVIFDKKVKQYSLTKLQWILLFQLYREEGISQSKLAMLLDSHKTVVGKIIDRSEANGLVVRREDPHDRRVKLIYLTKKSKKILQKIGPLSDEMVTASIAEMSEQDSKTLIGLLKVLRSTLVKMLA